MASEKQHVTQWEDFMKEQHSKQAEVDEEHRKAMEKLREQSRAKGLGDKLWSLPERCLLTSEGDKM